MAICMHCHAKFSDIKTPVFKDMLVEDGVAVQLDCWCICLCYLHFAPENPKDGDMYLLVSAHPGCQGQSPESCKMVVCVLEGRHTDRQLSTMFHTHKREK